MNTKRTWINGVEVYDKSNNKFEGFIDEHTSHWKECRIGWFSRRCSYSNKVLWPFTKATQRSLMHVSDKGMYSKRFYARCDEAIIANLKMD